MATPYDLIFDAFTSKIKDKIFIELSQIDAEDQMIQLLNDGLIYFKYPKVNVFDKDDDLKQFNVDLDYNELQIISHLMVLAWLDRQINNIELIKQKFSDKDFKITSQASHLESLLELQDKQTSKCNKIMRSYYSISNNKSCLTGLASDSV